MNDDRTEVGLMEHGTQVPTKCSECGKPILAGTGKFVVEGGGVRHVHVGACAVSAGAFPGGSAAVWGERSALASHMIGGMTEIAAAEACQWRDAPESGFVLLDALFAMLQVAAIVFFATCVYRIADHRGAFVAPVAHAEAAVVAIDHSLPRGSSR